jgi:hypothetical protein
MGIRRKKDLEGQVLVETISPETCFILKGGSEITENKD